MIEEEWQRDLRDHLNALRANDFIVIDTADPDVRERIVNALLVADDAATYDAWEEVVADAVLAALRDEEAGRG